MAGFITYDIKGGVEYAKFCVSRWKEGKVVKEYTNLGRVLDKERGIYRNRKQGVFVFDSSTHQYNTPPEEFVPEIPPRKNQKEELILTFGASYLLNTYIKSIGFDKCILNLDYGNKDTLISMVLFYILESRPNSYAESWYRKSYTKILYPKANLSSQRISDFLSGIGEESRQRKFFSSYFEWLKQTIGDTEFGNILIDSTGIPNNIHFPFTAISNHNGKISNEVRLIYVVHQKSGMPIYFRYCPGNIIDSTTIVRTVSELKQNKIDINHVILDAGYYTRENTDTFYKNNINFITRMQSNRILYKQIVKRYLGELEKKENFTRFGSRCLYIKSIECEIQGINTDYKAYAYLIKDINRAFDEEKKAILNGISDNLDESTIYDNMQGKGLFIIISSSNIDIKEILPIYYIRQQIEQVFDICKNNTSLAPLRTNKEDTFRGHLIITFIATVIFRKLQLLMENFKNDPAKSLYILDEQYCKVYDDKVIPSEPTKQINDIYKLAKIECPSEIIREHG